MSGLRVRWIGVLLIIATLWFVFASLKAVSYLDDERHRADTFAADQADVLHTTATVTDVGFSKFRKAGSTDADVTWAAGAGSDHIFLSRSADVTSQAPVGSRLPVEVWRGHVMRFELAGQWHTTDEYPTAVLGDFQILVCLFTAGAAVCGRMSAHVWLDNRVDHKRFLAGDLLVLPFLVATVGAAATSHPAPLTYLAPCTIAAVLVSALALPAVPWMRAPSHGVAR